MLSKKQKFRLQELVQSQWGNTDWPNKTATRLAGPLEQVSGVLTTELLCLIGVSFLLQLIGLAVVAEWVALVAFISGLIWCLLLVTVRRLSGAREWQLWVKPHLLQFLAVTPLAGSLW